MHNIDCGICKSLVSKKKKVQTFVFFLLKLKNRAHMIHAIHQLLKWQQIFFLKRCLLFCAIHSKRRRLVQKQKQKEIKPQNIVHHKSENIRSMSAAEQMPLTENNARYTWPELQRRRQTIPAASGWRCSPSHVLHMHASRTCLWKDPGLCISCIQSTLFSELWSISFKERALRMAPHTPSCWQTAETWGMTCWLFGSSMTASVFIQVS